jgi:hypothetical protein
MPQKIAGNPMSNVMFVTLLTSALVITSSPGPPLRPSTNAKIKFPTPEQYGMMSVPSTVPSNPPSFITSSRQMIKTDAAMNRVRNSHGAQAPVLSIE